jgi:hypothetical protein
MVSPPASLCFLFFVLVFGGRQNEVAVIPGKSVHEVTTTAFDSPLRHGPTTNARACVGRQEDEGDERSNRASRSFCVFGGGRRVLFSSWGRFLACCSKRGGLVLVYSCVVV